jgi:hypothetical protein
MLMGFLLNLKLSYAIIYMLPSSLSHSHTLFIFLFFLLHFIFENSMRIYSMFFTTMHYVCFYYFFALDTLSLNFFLIISY